MSRKREPVRRIKEVLRLAYLEALSERQIALGANMKKTTVHDYLLRARRASVTWSDVQAMDDDGLERLLFPAEAPAEVQRAVPDWGTIHTELHRKHVTLQLLWEEYRHEHAGGYSYSRFCELYQHFAGTLEVSMRQTHRAGDKAFVDYSGDGVEYRRCAAPERSAERRSSSACLARAATPMLRQHGPRNWPTGSGPMSGCCSSFRAFPLRSSRTI